MKKLVYIICAVVFAGFVAACSDEDIKPSSSAVPTNTQTTGGW